jgi:hypothetical protein
LTASSLPVALFAVLTAAIGDLVDRRRFLLVAQGLMLLAAAALGFLALAGLVTPWVLLSWPRDGLRGEAPPPARPRHRARPATARQDPHHDRPGPPREHHALAHSTSP